MASPTGHPAPTDPPVDTPVVRSRASSISIAAEWLAWTAALICLTTVAVVSLSGRLGARRELAAFAAARAESPLTAGTPDLALWSPERVGAWRESLRTSAVPLAVMRIRRLGIEAPVLEGTDDWTLNRGVGHIGDTAAPGDKGNSGIAGHRDGFFRALKDVAAGDTIELDTLHGTERYRVERSWIVAPEDVSVLDPTPVRALTLVTCYPFYFVGSAPQRFIVRAVIVRQ